MEKDLLPITLWNVSQLKGFCRDKRFWQSAFNRHFFKCSKNSLNKRITFFGILTYQGRLHLSYSLISPSEDTACWRLAYSEAARSRRRENQLPTVFPKNANSIWTNLFYFLILTNIYLSINNSKFFKISWKMLIKMSLKTRILCLF